MSPEEITIHYSTTSEPGDFDELRTASVHVGRKLKDRCHKEGSISIPRLWFPAEIHSYVVLSKNSISLKAREWTNKTPSAANTGHYIISKDGKMLTITGRRQRSDGSAGYLHRGFEKQ